MGQIDNQNLAIVILSLFISVYSSFVTFGIARRIKENSGILRLLMLFYGSFVMGFGIWAMHFIGMLSYRFSFNVSYDIDLTILSIFTSMFACFLVLRLLTWKFSAKFLSLFGGIILSIGIVMMHFIGMEAINEIEIYYNNSYMLSLSILLTLIMSVASLWLFLFYCNSGYKVFIKLISSICLGAGISSMHYTAMGAITDFVKTGHNHTIFVNQLFVAIAIGVITIAIIIFSQVMVIKEKNTAYLTKKISEQHFQTLFNNNHNLVMLLNNVGEIKQVNNVCKLLLGFSKEEIINKNIKDISGSADKLKFNSILNQIKTSESKNFEITLIHKNGAKLFLSTTTIPLMINDKITGFYLIGTDLSEQKLLEAQINNSEKLYRQVLTTMSEGLIVINKSGEIIVTNQTAADILGIPMKHLLNHNLFESVKDIILEDGSIFQSNCPGKITLETGTSIHNYIVGIKRANNMIKWVSIDSEPFHQEDKGELAGAVVTLTNVTSLKRKEKQLKESNMLMMSALDNLQAGVILLENNKKVKFINSEFIDLLGLKHNPYWYIDKNIFRLLSIYIKYFDKINSKNESFDSVFSNNGEVKKEEVYLPNGQVLLITYVPIIINKSNKFDFWKINDITHQKHVEETLITAKENAEKANLAKSSFLSMMTHELRTPLNGILGYAQLLDYDKEEPLTERQRDFVDQISNAGSHLLNLINGILDITRIESKNIALTFHTVNIYSIINHCITMIMPLARQRSIQVHAHIDHIKNTYIFGDETRLKQIMLNLLSNGIKFNKSNGEVIVSADLSFGHIRIYVQDTGPGIPLCELNNIYKPFQRIYSSTYHSEGAGIGLTLVNQLVLLMNGKHGVDSKQGKGSSFWIEFKVVEQENHVEN